jgi:hypothetical protein
MNVAAIRGTELHTVRRIGDEIKQRVKQLLAELPVITG